MYFNKLLLHRWANSHQTHWACSKALNDEKLSKGLPKVKGRGQGHEFRSFATKLQTVITSVSIVWYYQNCFWYVWWECRPEHVCTAILTHNHSATYWRHKLSRFYTFPLIQRHWSPLALTYMHETLWVHRTCRDVQISLLDSNPKPNRKTAIAHSRCYFRRFFDICMQCILTHSSYTVDPIPTKLGKPVLMASTRKNHQKVFQKSKGVARAEPWTSLFRH